MIEKQKEKEMFKFDCPYCKETFYQRVGSAGGGVDQAGRKIHKITDQVKCTNCFNFLKSPK